MADSDQPDKDYNDDPNDDPHDCNDDPNDDHSDYSDDLPKSRQQARPLQQSAEDLSISALFAALDSEVANRTSDRFVNDFQQKWKFRLPSEGHVVTSIRPGGHMQRERLKHKADHISRWLKSRSTADIHSCTSNKSFFTSRQPSVVLCHACKYYYGSYIYLL